MPSPRTETDRSGPAWGLGRAQGLTAFLQRLNTRLVMAIGSVALISLLISFAMNVYNRRVALVER
jgi:hypothetical protein